LFRILKPDRAAYVFMGWRSLGVWLDAFSAAGFRLKNVIVWDKVVHGLNWQNYAHTHEFVIFAVKGRFYPDNKQYDDEAWKDIWRIKRQLSRTSAQVAHHETVKPLELIRRPIEHATVPGDIVLDPFAGTATTCVAAKSLGRRYIGIEREKAYYEVGCARLLEVSSPLTTDDCRAKPARCSTRRRIRCRGERA
jgi:site-specific DNA-methyltransferase (adenine-specific)